MGDMLTIDVSRFFREVAGVILDNTPSAYQPRPLQPAGPRAQLCVCGADMEVVSTFMHSGNRMVRNNWKCPVCKQVRVEDAVMR